MSDGIRILITSDLHLGIKDSPVPEDFRLKTFKRIVSLAMEYDVLLIAGDFMELTGPVSPLFRSVNEEFNELRDGGVTIVYSPGGSELFGSGDAGRVLDDLSVNRLFMPGDDPAPYLYEKEGQRLYLYGVPAGVNPVKAGVQRLDEGGFHMGLFHVDFNPDVPLHDVGVDGPHPYRMRRDDIKNIGLDFYAFGSNHNFRMFKIQDRIIAAYPGSPEAVSLAETGDRYVISCDVVRDELQNIKRLSVNTIGIESCELDCSRYRYFGEVVTVLDEMKSKKLHLTVTLTGSRNFRMGLDAIGPLRNEFFALQVDDMTQTTMDFLLSEYGDEESLRGELLRIIVERIQDAGISSDTSEADIVRILTLMISGGSESLEGWLCSI
ncbi:MAG: hypothetical protein JXA20_16950 [Spirochaetes bacterium]|nr:hypothetical protein [Spirochaetota bacterium]